MPGLWALSGRGQQQGCLPKKPWKVEPPRSGGTFPPSADGLWQRPADNKWQNILGFWIVIWLNFRAGSPFWGRNLHFLPHFHSQCLLNFPFWPPPPSAAGLLAPKPQIWALLKTQDNFSLLEPILPPNALKPLHFFPWKAGKFSTQPWNALHGPS